MCIQLWFNKMSEGDLGQLLWGIITFYREPGSRCSAKWWSDICAYYVTYKLYYKADAVGGCGWWHFNGSCDLLYIICMSTSPRMEQKQRDCHPQHTAEICVIMPEKQQRKTLICESRTVPDAHSDLHKKQEAWRQRGKVTFLPRPKRKRSISYLQGVIAADKMATQWLCKILESMVFNTRNTLHARKFPHPLNTSKNSKKL